MTPVLVILALFLSTATSSYINCTYEYFHGYKCKVTYLHIDSKDHQFIQYVNGDHLDNKTNADVDGVGFTTFNIDYLPRNLEKIFPNINIITAVWVGLQELTNDDIKPFGEKLKYLWLNGNKIKAIESDTFADNPNLEVIVLQHNEIEKIERGAFDNLTQITALNLEHNKCISQGYFGGGYLSRFTIEAERKCKGIN